MNLSAVECRSLATLNNINDNPEWRVSPVYATRKQAHFRNIDALFQIRTRIMT
jgi:hypothetical protein